MNPERYNRLEHSSKNAPKQSNEWVEPPPSAQRIKWIYMTPLAFAPTLPLIRIAFRCVVHEVIAKMKI